MLTRALLEALAQERDPDGGIVTLYLSVFRETPGAPRYHARFRQQMANLDPTRRQRAARALQVIESWLQGRGRRLKRGLFVLVNPRTGTALYRDLQLLLPERLVVDQTPYLKTLADVLDNHPPYIAALVDRHRGRLYGYFLGELNQDISHHRDDIPPRHRRGGWRNLAANRYRRSRRQMEDRHLAEVATDLKKVLHQAGRDARLFVGGPVEARARFTALLPPGLAEKVTATFACPLEATPEEVRRRLVPLVRQAEARKDEALARAVLTAARTGGRGAAGLGDVLWHARAGNIHRLAVRQGLRAEGLHCRRCGALLAAAPVRCPYCGDELEPAPLLVDDLVQSTLQQGAWVQVLRVPTVLDDAGGVGALLRGV